MGNNEKNAGQKDPLAAMAQRIKELEAANDALKASNAKKGKVSMKVSEKGALSLYGMGRFPVTLYRSQWETLLAEADGIRAFIVAHPELKTKEEAVAVKSGPQALVTAPKSAL